MITTAVNIWGQQADVDIQRTDLWRLNLRTAISALDQLPSEAYAVLGLTKQRLPTPEDASFYATRVSLPVQKIEERHLIQSGSWRYVPGYAAALDTARVDFIHDAHEVPSAIYTLLSAWRQLVRVGRTDRGGLVTLPLLTAESRPTFRFDIDVQLAQGDPNLAENFVYGTKYTLAKCWPSTIQQGSLDRSANAQIHTISVQFQVQEIIPHTL